jgi:hypothetical protein
MMVLVENSSAEKQGDANPRSSLAASFEAPPACGLSNDYLNHYSEALMLIEMAPYDTSLLNDLAQWQPLDYCDYFKASPLRRAPSALTAYEALSVEQRAHFEARMDAVNGLVQTSIMVLQTLSDPDDMSVVVESMSSPLRSLMEGAARFLNHNGLMEDDEAPLEQAQAAIDDLLKVL